MTTPRSRKEDGSTWKRSVPLRAVLHYANARPTEQSWQNVVLGPARRDVIGGGKWPKDKPPFGVPSLAECETTLRRFRDFVVAFTKLKSPTTTDAVQLAETLAARARLVPHRFGFDQRTSRLVQRWTTQEDSFEEILYAQLALALQEVPYSWLHRCENCEIVFASDSKREIKYCSPRCRNRALVRRHRQRLAGRSQPQKRSTPKRAPDTERGSA
ncbi:MAG: CGNR zinc finger domain-containing protein [Candidatus Binatia bacterium]